MGRSRMAAADALEGRPGLAPALFGNGRPATCGLGFDGLPATRERRSIRAGIALGPSVSPPDIASAQRLVGLHLAKAFGGVSIVVGRGYWSPSGDEDVADYTGAYEEAVLWVALLVMPDQQERAANLIRECGGLLKRMGLAPDISRFTARSPRLKPPT